ncbi:MAG: hypothetical protein WC415_04715 [Patescibacteria group bacterium]|jgi:hypothetical protein
MIKVSNETLGKAFLDILKDVLFFPFWWYSVGLFKFGRVLLIFLGNREKVLAWSVWAGNIFTPMYGLRDIQGVIISFFIRIIQVVFRSIIMLFWLTILSAVLLIYLVFPPFAIYEIIFQLK